MSRILVGAKAHANFITEHLREHPNFVYHCHERDRKLLNRIPVELHGRIVFDARDDFIDRMESIAQCAPITPHSWNDVENTLWLRKMAAQTDEFNYIETAKRKNMERETAKHEVTQIEFAERNASNLLTDDTRVWCCDGEPPYVAFAAYIASKLQVPLVSIPKPQIADSPKPGETDICFGSYWSGVKTAFTYESSKYDSLFEATRQCLDEYDASIAESDMALQLMNDREHGRDNATTQAFISGLKVRYGAIKAPDTFTIADMFLWYFTGENVPPEEQLIAVGRDIATYVEYETQSAVDAYAIEFGKVAVIVSGLLHVSALHDALRKRYPECEFTLVIWHKFLTNRNVQVFYSARCYVVGMSALCYLKEHLSDVSGIACTAGGFDAGQWFEQLKAEFMVPKLE